VSGRLQALRARAGSWPPYRFDLVLAAVLFTEGMAEAALGDASWPARLAAAGPLAIVAAGVAVRRRAALAACVLAVAGIAAISLLQDPLQEALQGPYFGWLFVTYSLAARESRRTLLLGVAITLAGVAAITAAEGGNAGDVLLAGVLFVLGPVLAGRVLYSRLNLNRALAEKGARLERERRSRAEEAATDERARIAGELHDVVAHALGAMTIQAAAARRLATRDSARAAGAFEAIETTGREALGEIRTLLDVLRAGEEDEPALEPQPGLAGLRSLVDRVRAAGLPVDLEVHGSAPGDLPASVDLTAYRVVQEALSAALEHGGAGHAQVWVGYDEDAVAIRVADDGGRDGMRPLLGMRERVALYGGEVSAGPADTGHVVEARLPLEGVHA